MTELTDEQKKFLEECETEFANRYTEEDKDFMQVATPLMRGLCGILPRIAKCWKPCLIWS